MDTRIYRKSSCAWDNSPKCQSQTSSQLQATLCCSRRAYIGSWERNLEECREKFQHKFQHRRESISPQINFEHPLVSFIILFVWSELHFGTINWGHVAVDFCSRSATQWNFSQASPESEGGAAAAATKPNPQIGFAGHGVLVQKIVESFRHVHVVSVSRFHLSPGRWPCYACVEERMFGMKVFYKLYVWAAHTNFIIASFTLSFT